MKTQVQNYITEIRLNQNLSKHTIKAYQIDLNQHVNYLYSIDFISFSNVNKKSLNVFFGSLKNTYKITTLKRKIVSIKKFYMYLYDERIILENPFVMMKFKLKPDLTIPKTISFSVIKKIYRQVYKNLYESSKNELYYFTEVLMIELMYTTGVRVSELCNIKLSDINLQRKTILIRGKGRKERIVFISEKFLVEYIEKYKRLTPIKIHDYLLSNKMKSKLSEQSVRFRLNRLCREANVNENITPHMFRHTFATSLLEEEVNLMYIQELLGHSSLSTTQIYIKINKKKQQRIISKKHPRNKIVISSNKG